MKRVLLLTPYSPLKSHDHAAGDLAAPFMSELARLVDLHVYAADGEFDGEVILRGGGRVTMHRAAPPKMLSRWSHLGPHPRMLRAEWQRTHTAEVRRLARHLQPDVVHVEYLQPCEVLRHVSSGCKRTITLHDITQRVARELLQSPKSPRAILRWIDFMRLRRAENRAIRSADHVFVFSERDAAFCREVQRLAGDTGSRISVAQIGIEAPQVNWGASTAAHVLFAGALWREPNERSAVYLVEHVMPIVWRTMPEAIIRIVGSRPTARVQALGTNANVEVVADVENLDIEFARAAVNLAPSVVPAGILLKALRAMSLGAPVILNSASAAPIEGLVAGRHALVADDAEAYAAAIVRLLNNRDEAAELGRAGADLIRANYSWQRSARHYEQIFGDLPVKATH